MVVVAEHAQTEVGNIIHRTDGHVPLSRNAALNVHEVHAFRGLPRLY